MREMNIFTAIILALGFIIPFAVKKVDCMECAGSFKLDQMKQRHDKAVVATANAAADL